MKCSFGISDFLEEIPSLSRSVVFLYFFAMIAEEVCLISSAFRCLYLSFSPLLFASLLFTAICKASPDSHFAFLPFFSMGMVLIPVSCTMSRTSFHSSLGTLIYQITLKGADYMGSPHQRCPQTVPHPDGPHIASMLEDYPEWTHVS